MAARDQCDRPLVRLESQRNSPATGFQSYPGRVPGVDIDMGIVFLHSASEVQALQSPFTLKSSSPAGHPRSSPSTCPSPLNLSQGTPDRDHIDMLSTILSFGATPDITTSLVVYTHEDFVRITSLERQVCSNYVCCGNQLDDFHALINHFEEGHISVVAPNGKRIYPPEGLKQVQQVAPTPPVDRSVSSPSLSFALPSTTSTQSSSRTSSVVSSSPITPLTPVVHTDIEYNPFGLPQLSVGTSASNQRSPYNSEIISAFGPEYDFSQDYACYELYYAEKIQRLRQQECGLTRIEEEAHAFANVGSSATDEEIVDASCPASPDADVPLPSQKSTASSSKKKVSKARLDRETPGVDGSISNNGGKVAKSKAKVTDPSVHPTLFTGRKREKTYRCPHHGCSKSYLNPNGLKYHLEKGTCKFDDPENGAARPSDCSMGSLIEETPAGTPASEYPASSLPGVPAATTSDAVASTSLTPLKTFSKLKSNHCPTPNSPESLGLISAFSSITPKEVSQSILMQATPQLRQPQVPSQGCDAAAEGSDRASSVSPVPDGVRVSGRLPVRSSRLSPDCRDFATIPYASGRGQLVCDGGSLSYL